MKKPNKYIKSILVKKKKNKYFDKAMYFFIYFILLITLGLFKHKDWKTRTSQYKELISGSVANLSSNSFLIATGQAFYILISFIPIITVIMILLANIDFRIGNSTQFNVFVKSDILNRFIPGIETALPDFLVTFKKLDWKNVGFIFLVFSTLWISINGYSKLIAAQSTIYNHKNKGSWLYSKLKALSIVLAIIVFVTISLIIITPFMMYLKEVDKAHYEIYFYLFCSFYLLFFFTIGWLLMFKWLPVFKLKFQDIVPGWIIASLSSSLFAMLFGYLVSNKFIKYDKYGTMASFLYLSTFSLYISYFFYFGLTINYSYAQVFSTKTFQSKNFSKYKVEYTL